MKSSRNVVTGARKTSWSENLRQTLTISAFLGLLAGFGEGVLDLTRNHYHAPPILCTALLADLPFFLVLGLALWLLSRAFRRALDPAVTLLVLLFALLYYLARVAFPDPDLRIFFLVVSAAIAMLAALYELGHRGLPARVMRGALPWVAGAALISLATVPVLDSWTEHRALNHLPAISAQAPNVVLVIIDTLRADHLSVYGYGRPTSPEIDRLARQGVLFDDAIAASSWTLPSHASMMTGTYPHVHHTDTLGRALPPDIPTLASALGRDGYRTAAFSANIYFFDRQRGFGHGFTHFGDFFLSPAEALDQVHYAEAIDKFLRKHRFTKDFLGRQTAANINRAALHWIEGGHRPFFLALNYLDVHDPYVPPQPWRHRFSKRLDPGGRIDTGVFVFPPLTPAQMQDEVNAYDGAISYVDDQLRHLVSQLRRQDLLANTLLIVTSDHGEAFGGHGLISHANALYFPLIHVPLLFRWPGHIPAGIRVSRPVSTIDIGATILALIHSRPNHFPGRSLAALWTGQADPDSWPLPISELAKLKTPPRFPDHYGPLSSVVSSDMQYIVDPRLGTLLYNWKTDPKETHNLYRNPRYQAVAATLAVDLRESGARPLPPPNAPSASPQARNKPRTTGTPGSNGKHARRP